MNTLGNVHDGQRALERFQAWCDAECIQHVPLTGTRWPSPPSKLQHLDIGEPALKRHWGISVEDSRQIGSCLLSPRAVQACLPAFAALADVEAAQHHWIQTAGATTSCNQHKLISRGGAPHTIPITRRSSLHAKKVPEGVRHRNRTLCESLVSLRHALIVDLVLPAPYERQPGLVCRVALARGIKTLEQKMVMIWQPSAKILNNWSKVALRTIITISKTQHILHEVEHRV